MRHIFQTRVSPGTQIPDPAVLEEVVSHLEPAMIEMERLVHGSTTGIDVKTVVRGGALYIEKSKEVTRFEVSKNVGLLLVDTGVRQKTKEVVAIVKKKREENQGGVEEIMKEIGETTLKIKKALDSQPVDWNALLGFVSHNQKMLGMLGVSCDQIEEIVNYVTAYSIPCKMTGKGLGGFVICLYDTHTHSEYTIDSIVEHLGKMGYNAVKSRLSSEGIKCSIEY